MKFDGRQRELCNFNSQYDNIVEQLLFYDSYQIGHGKLPWG